MDKNTLSILEDYNASLEDSFKKIDKTIKNADKSDKNKKRAILSSLKQEIANIKSNYGLMKSELNNLLSEENKTNWSETVSKIKPKIKNYEKKIKKFEEEMTQIPMSGQVEDHLDVDAKVDLNQLNAQQVIARGDKILDVDDQAIDNMAKVVYKDVDQMKNVNVELNAQQEKLENVDADLKEMDYSLKRAGKQITNMFKMYSHDRCITGLIIVILIIIVVIIIVAACGGDNEKNFNVPHDIFSSNNKNSTTNAGGLIYGNNLGINNYFVGIGLILMQVLL